LGFSRRGTSPKEAHAYRTDRILPSDAVSAAQRVPPLRGEVSRGRQSPQLHLHGQFLCLAFAQLTYRESLRDIETCLRAMQPKLYHMGIRGRVSRSTLAEANESRDWRIYADFAQALIAQARPLYQNEGFGVELENAAYALDSTTIDLCLSLFPWARFRKTKGR